ncbi:hypothetical protein O181_098826 [Austropuccinia psidii MF-1]|uniref:Uncharacterized protein n=1 Tax=Austropuccinia psidii MF-1 TaxID=1389203 RepID=A0A9Q3JC79_9BASI|nr:hypothetical protein [Austropuccinia psidii MF-1]
MLLTFKYLRSGEWQRRPRFDSWLVLATGFKWWKVESGDSLGCGVGDDLIGEARKGLEVEGLGVGGGMEDGSEDRKNWKFFGVLKIM